MTRLNTDHLLRGIQTLDRSLALLGSTQTGTIEHEVFRNAVVKGFEPTLETSGKLLRRALKSFESAPRTVDGWVYKDLIRNGAKHGLLSEAEVQRWFAYRDNRNNTAHDYGVGFAQETLQLLPGFVADAKRLEGVLREKLGRADP